MLENISISVADIVIIFKHCDATICINNNSSSKFFFLNEKNTNANVSYNGYVHSKNKIDFPTGKLLYQGLPWEDIEIPYNWFVWDINGNMAISVDFINNTELNSALIILDNTEFKIQYYIDFKGKSIDFDPFMFPLGILIQIYLVHFQKGLVIHASGVNDNSNGYLFTGISGIGKSTMARLWKQAGATVINDDRLVILPIKNDYTIFNTPMPYYDDVPKKASLKGIFILIQSPNNYYKKITGASSMMRLMANCMQHFHSELFIQSHLSIIESITNQVPVFELGFKPDQEIIELIRELKL